MFVVLVFALFLYSICENEIECSAIRHGSIDADVKDSTKLTGNLTFLKKIENVVLQSQSMASSPVKNKEKIMSTNKDNPEVDLDGAHISTSPLLEKENGILISNRKDLRPKDNGGRRQPKFFGSLAFLAGLGAGGLASAASGNVNTFANLLNGAIPLTISPQRYFAGFYEPQQFLPFVYPVFYPVPRLNNNYQNFVSGIPMIPPPPAEHVHNVTAENSLQKGDTNLGRNEGADKKSKNEKVQKDKEAAAATETEFGRTIAAVVNDDDIDSSVTTEEKITELRQGSSTSQESKTSTTTPISDIKTTAIPSTTNTTVVAENNTIPTPSPTNSTESLTSYGYYGGNPQDVGHVMFTTEDSPKKYLKDYTSDAFSVPFERPAVFNPYQNVDSAYQSPFVNSFSPGDSYPEYLNTIESDRYLYDSDNRRSFNGFRPITK